MSSHLTTEQINSLLTEKGAKAVEDGFNLAICIHITPDKVGVVGYDEAYTFKLHNRMLKDYLETLYQMNGQVNTLLSKLVHNLVAVSELIELGYLDEDQLELLLPRLMDKFELLELGEYSGLFDSFESPKDLKDYYVIHYKGYASINRKENFKLIVADVGSGHWEGGSPKEQIKALKEAKGRK